MVQKDDVGCYVVGHMKKDCPKSSMTSSGESSTLAQVNAVVEPLKSSTTLNIEFSAPTQVIVVEESK